MWQLVAGHCTQGSVAAQATGAGPLSMDPGWAPPSVWEAVEWVALSRLSGLSSSLSWATWGRTHSKCSVCSLGDERLLLFQARSVWTWATPTCAAAGPASQGGTARTTWTTAPPPRVPMGAPAGTA